MTQPPSSVLFREIHKNAWLRRLPVSDKKGLPHCKKTMKVWVVFCVHDDVDPFLEFYLDHEQSAAHKPDVSVPLSQTLHVSPTLCAHEDEFEFVITLQSDIIRLTATSWDQMMEWVESITGKLREMKILSPKENLYSKMPEQKPPLLPTRDPNSPLPLPPVGPASLLPGVEPVQHSDSGSERTTISSPSTPIRLNSYIYTRALQRLCRDSSLNETPPTSPRLPLPLQPSNPVLPITTPLLPSNNITVIEVNPSDVASVPGAPSNGALSSTSVTVISRTSSVSSTSVASSVMPSMSVTSAATNGDAVFNFSFVNEALVTNEEDDLFFTPPATPVLPRSSMARFINPLNLPRPTSQTTSTTNFDPFQPSNSSQNVSRNHSFNNHTSLHHSNEILSRVDPFEPIIDSKNKSNKDQKRTDVLAEDTSVTNTITNVTSPMSCSTSSSQGSSTSQDTKPSRPSSLASVVTIAAPNKPVITTTAVFTKASSSGINILSSKSSVLVSNSASNNYTKVSEHKSDLPSVKISTPATTISNLVSSSGNVNVILPTTSVPVKQPLVRRNSTSNDGSGTLDVQVDESITVGGGVTGSHGNLYEHLFLPQPPTTSSPSITESAVITTSSSSVSTPSQATSGVRSRPTGRTVNPQPNRPRRRSSSNSESSTHLPHVPADRIRVVSQRSQPAVSSVRQGPEQLVSTSRLTLREQQVLQLKREMMHPGGVRLQLRKKDCVGSIALVDAFNAVWIAGWKQKEHPMLYNALHIGDQILKIGGVFIQNAADAQKLIGNTKGLYVEFVILRVPRGRVYAILREHEGQDLGIVQENTAEIVDVVPNTVAHQNGITFRCRTMEGLGLTTWWITEINGRPLNLFFKDNEVRDRLNCVGLDISLLIQPFDLIKQIKKQMRSIRGYKNYIVQ